MTRTLRTINPGCGIIADMVRVLTGVAAWLAGTAVAVSLAWFGAGLVIRNTTASPSVPVISVAPAPATNAPATNGAPGTPSAAPRKHDSRSRTATPGPRPSTSAASAGKGAAAKRATAKATATAASTGVPGTSAPSTGAPSTANGSVRDYAMTGGQVTLLVSQTSAKLVTAVPDAGFSVQTWSGTDWLRVDFSSGPQVSSLIASWNGHAPFITVTN
jgi:hypothetical protein